MLTYSTPPFTGHLMSLVNPHSPMGEQMTNSHEPRETDGLWGPRELLRVSLLSSRETPQSAGFSDSSGTPGTGNPSQAQEPNALKLTLDYITCGISGAHWHRPQSTRELPFLVSSLRGYLFSRPKAILSSLAVSAPP